MGLKGPASESASCQVPCAATRLRYTLTAPHATPPHAETKHASARAGAQQLRIRAVWHWARAQLSPPNWDRTT